MSIGEVLNLYKDSELDIHPEFQRVFRWSIQQKSRLIESLLLGIPLPPIYVAVNSRGVWEVIDGVQRLSTIFEFMGELRGPESEESDEIVQKPPLTLEPTKHLPGLSGVKFASIDQALRLEFKRTRLDVKVLAREEGGAGTGKFDLFERLNTYGAALSPQELRNCVLVSLNPELYRRIKRLAENEAFRSCTLLTETQLQERYDMDLALRFMVLRGVNPKAIGDVHDFLRDRMEEVALDQSFDISAEETLFKEVFEYFDASLDGNAFRPWNRKTKTFRGAFSLGAFEGLALAIGEHWSAIRRVRDKFDIEGVVKALWDIDAYKRSFSGLRARERMVRVFPAAREVVVAELARSKSKKSALKSTSLKKGAAKVPKKSGRVRR
jgi:hypothetical protein